MIYRKFYYFIIYNSYLYYVNNDVIIKKLGFYFTSYVKVLSIFLVRILWLLLDFLVVRIMIRVTKPTPLHCYNFKENLLRFINPKHHKKGVFLALQLCFFALHRRMWWMCHSEVFHHRLYPFSLFKSYTFVWNHKQYHL